MRKYFENCCIQRLIEFSNNTVQSDILRLDRLHPIVSGNKWFKLKYYLEEAKQLRKIKIATFGGAYSNHIVATAYASREAGFKSIGFIRGEQSAELNPTLLKAREFGMELNFLIRSDYHDKEKVIQSFNSPELYWIPEGGYGIKGALGAAEILSITDTETYSHIICATGTGTMMAGLINRAKKHQQIIGISVLKNHFGLEKEVRSLLNNEEKVPDFRILNGYHFGGYGKHPVALISFMNKTWLTEQLPTDIVYTSKLLFAVQDLIRNRYFPLNSKLLIIHSGGLQGNNSLPKGILDF